MALRILRNHNGQQEVISEDLAAETGIVPDPSNYVVSFRVTKDRIYVLATEFNSQSAWNSEGLVLFYRDNTPGAPWSRFDVGDSSFNPPSWNHQFVQVLVDDAGRVFALDAYSSEGGPEYRARTVVIGADATWSTPNLSSNITGYDAYLYFAGPNNTMPVIHGERWLVGWDPATGGLYDVPHPPQIPASDGPVGQGFTLWTGVVAFAPDDIWAYQGDGAGGMLPEPETYLGYLIHWDGHQWDPFSRLQVSDARVDGFRCVAGNMAGRPGGGFIYLQDSPARLLPPGSDWVAVKGVDLWTQSVQDILARSRTTLDWAFQGSNANMRGNNPPGDYMSLGQGSWPGQWTPQGSIRAFADGSLFIPAMTQPLI